MHDPAVHVELAIARMNSTPKAKGLNGLFADVAEMHAGALCNVTDDAQGARNLAGKLACILGQRQ